MVRVTLRGALLLVLLTVTAGAAATVEENDAFLRGYAAAVLEREFRVTAPSLRVQYSVITVDLADLPAVNRDRIVATLSQLRGVARVDVRDAAAPPPSPPVGVPPVVTPAPPSTDPPRPRVLKALDFGLMPGGHLFDPLIADPRWPHFAAAHHYYLNQRELTNVGAVSFGESFALYRGRLGSGSWEVGVQAGVFAVFDLDAESKDLINADYLVGFPLIYRYRDFSALLRVFHQSSHVGDEFILRNRLRNRVNLSYEQVDTKLSYDLTEWLRIYAGAGYLFDQDPPDLKPWSTQWGAEFRSPWPSPEKGWRPVAAIDVQQREENAWHTDLSVRAGVQWDGWLAGRHFQLLLEYFRGHSPNGQFYEQKIDYLGLGAHFHF